METTDIRSNKFQKQQVSKNNIFKKTTNFKKKLIKKKTMKKSVVSKICCYFLEFVVVFKYLLYYVVIEIGCF